MHYYVAVTVAMSDRSRRRLNEDGSEMRPRVNIQTQYLRAFNREDAEQIAAGINEGYTTSHRDGPFEMHRTAEVCTFVRTGNGKGVYLTMSDVEMIVTEYTKPDTNDRTKAA